MTIIEREYERPPAINYDLSERDVAEKLWLWRHRQPSHRGIARGRRVGAMSQVEAAEALDLTPQQYTNLERGEATLFTAADLANLCRQKFWDDIEPTVAELCFLARRRSGMMVKDAAAILGVSPGIYTLAEQNGEARVRALWVEQGFRFHRVKRPGKAA